MCYLVAKDINDIGCVAWKTTHGKALAEFKSLLEEKVGYDRIQLITIRRPSAYGEYEPTGNDVRKMGNGAYVVLGSSRVAMMPYVCD